MRTAARKPFDHQCVADWTVRNGLRYIGVDGRFLRLAVVSRRTNDANDSAFKFNLSQYTGIPTTMAEDLLTLRFEGAPLVQRSLPIYGLGTSFIAVSKTDT